MIKYNAIIIIVIIILLIFYSYNVHKILTELFKNIFFTCYSSSQYINEKIQNLELFDSNYNNFGFIIIRHVNSETTNNYWIECIRCIRKFYDHKIVVIDDNSNPTYLNDNKNEFKNCEFVKSEFVGRGELLPYFYFYKNKYFHKAVIIHDSMFFNKYIDFNKIKSCKYIFYFKYHYYDDDENTINLLKHLKNPEYLIEQYNNKDNWKLCFGVQSVVTHNFLNRLQKKYGFLNLINHIKTRSDRMCLERIYGLLCTLEKKSLNDDPAMLGQINVHINWGYTYDLYMRDKKNDNLDNYIIVKVWSGR